MRKCEILSCEKKHYGNGLCQMHYLRKYRHGDIEHTKMPTKGLTDVEKFNYHTDKSSGDCWVWTGPKGRYGYGRMRVGKGKNKTYMHRYSWVLHNGPINNGLFVLHKCDNPSCVNPDHLFLGTQKDNVHDMRSKKRGKNQKNAPRLIKNGEISEIKKRLF